MGTFDDADLEAMLDKLVVFADGLPPAERAALDLVAVLALDGLADAAGPAGGETAGAEVAGHVLSTEGSAPVGTRAIAAFPDVCMTPPENPATPPGVPVPYPNLARSLATRFWR